MKRAGRLATSRRHLCSAELFQCVAAAGLAILFCATPTQSVLVPCNDASAGQIVPALAQIEGSVDPCGESAQVLEVVETLKHCPTAYQICTDSQIGRNVFDRPIGDHGDLRPRVIRWNPLLRSELERGCEGDPPTPVLRDPTASLLHELVHAAHDCQGINPGEHEIEAVRIENIYRRAVGLCQRTAYGEDALPPHLVKECTPQKCRCTAMGEAPRFW